MHYLDSREYRFYNVLFGGTVKLDQIYTALVDSDASHGPNFALCEPLDLVWGKLYAV